ncbi:N-acetyltransferase family protein, partial [Rhizobium ruizarguesonis]
RDIDNHAVEHTTAIWNDTLVALENRLEWFKARKARGFPFIVAEMSGKVAGYASYGDWRAFADAATAAILVDIEGMFDSVAVAVE